MREAILFGDWLIAKPQYIEILDFTAWNKIHDGKRNRWRFVPNLTLSVKGVFVEIIGYHEVWAFIDALIPKLPRKALNEVMKGRSEDYTFTEELAFFLHESERVVLMQLISPEGNGDLLRAVVIKGRDRPLCGLPIVTGDETLWKEGKTQGNFIVVKNTPEDFLVFWVITENGGSVRPERMVRFTTEGEVSLYIERKSGVDDDITREISTSCVKLIPSLRMRTTESDALEYSRFLNYFRETEDS